MLPPPERFDLPGLCLRLLRASDALAIFEGSARHPEVLRYMAWPPPRALADTAAYLASVRDDAERGTGFTYALLPAGATALQGGIGFTLHGGTASFGYVLAPAYWGRGLVVAAFAALGDWLLAQPSIYRVEAFCHTDNRRSARVMEKAGLAFEGRLRRHAVYPNLSAEPLDSLMYARVRPAVTGNGTVKHDEEN